MNAVTKEVVPGGPETTAVAQPAPVPVETMLMAGIERGLTPEGIEKLVELKLKLEAIRAEREFNEAMVDFQSECPSIPHNCEAKDRNGRVLYTYADADQIKKTIQPLLTKCRLSLSYDARFTDKSVEAVATVSHVGGHKRTATFSAPVSGTEMMSNAQKAASALSFASRYAMRQALGLTTEGKDDDGGAAGKSNRITEEQAANLRALMDEVKADESKFLKFLGAASIPEILAVDYDRAVKALERKRK